MAGDELKALMREVPQPVSVVTVDAGGQKAGLTVVSLVSLSLEPPLVGVAVATPGRAPRARYGRRARLRSASSPPDRRAWPSISREAFRRSSSGTGIETRDGELGAPLLEGALGWIECRLASEHPTGDHTFFVGDVVSAVRGPGREALVHLRQAYT